MDEEKNIDATSALTCIAAHYDLFIRYYNMLDKGEPIKGISDNGKPFKMVVKKVIPHAEEDGFNLNILKAIILTIGTFGNSLRISFKDDDLLEIYTYLEDYMMMQDLAKNPDSGVRFDSDNKDKYGFPEILVSQEAVMKMINKKMRKGQDN